MIREISLENLFTSIALMKATASFMLGGINSNVTVSRYHIDILNNSEGRDVLAYQTLNGKNRLQKTPQL